MSYFDNIPQELTEIILFYATDSKRTMLDSIMTGFRAGSELRSKKPFYEDDETTVSCIIKSGLFSDVIQTPEFWVKKTIFIFPTLNYGKIVSFFDRAELELHESQENAIQFRFVYEFMLSFSFFFCR